MRKVLLAWLGKGDLEGHGGQCEQCGAKSPSRLLAAVTSPKFGFDEVVVLNDRASQKKSAQAWLESLQPKTSAKLVLSEQSLKNPIEYEPIYRGALSAIRETLERNGAGTRLHFLLNSGTEPMGAVWLLIGKSKHPATLVAVEKKSGGLVEVPVPFDVAAEFLPEVLRGEAPSLDQLLGDRAPPAAAFSDVIGNSPAIRTAIEQARLFAASPAYPVLIEGETGTGKELFANAIHAGSRRTGQHIAVNCGAIPSDLIESELFGHVKGAFTGATQAEQGAFRAANRGTLFLDEVGDLPREAQVKLLRVLEVGRVRAVGSPKEERVDVRIIAATHRNLMDEVVAGRFREDLYYRLAVGSLFLPPLRERTGDLGLLLDFFLQKTNEELQERGLGTKELTAAARAVFLAHPWPGNVRELRNTLRRCAMLTPGPTIQEATATLAIGASRTRRPAEVDAPIAEGFDVQAHVASLEARYIQRALQQCGGNQTRAAELLGYASRQAMASRMRITGELARAKSP